MEIKEWLNHVRKLSDEIKQLKDAEKKAFSSACGGGVSYEKEKIQISKVNSSEAKFIDYSDYSILVKNKTEELERYQKEVLTAIYMIDDTVLRTLLIARYINCKTWERIAEDMGYSEKWVKTGLHSKALKAFGKVRK